MSTNSCCPCSYCTSFIVSPGGMNDFTPYIDYNGYIKIDPELETIIRETHSMLKQLLKEKENR